MNKLNLTVQTNCAYISGWRKDSHDPKDLLAFPNLYLCLACASQKYVAKYVDFSCLNSLPYQDNANCGHYWVGHSDKVGFKITHIVIRLEIIL